jgi:hypothetical protein
MPPAIQICSRPSARLRQIEASIGAFDLHGPTRLQALREAAGVVAQGLDLEAHPTVAAVGAGDREGMRTLQAIEGREGELPRPVSAPALVEPADHLGDARAGVADRLHHAADAAVLADAPGQHPHAGDRAGGDQAREQHADRLRPVVERRQEGGVEGERRYNTGIPL